MKSINPQGQGARQTPDTGNVNKTPRKRIKFLESRGEEQSVGWGGGHRARCRHAKWGQLHVAKLAGRPDDPSRLGGTACLPVSTESGSGDLTLRNGSEAEAPGVGLLRGRSASPPQEDGRGSPRADRQRPSAEGQVCRKEGAGGASRGCQRGSLSFSLKTNFFKTHPLFKAPPKW